MEIRALETFEEYEQCISLQQRVWQYSDRDLLPARYLRITHMHGGSVLGAFEPANRLVAFAFAQPSIHQGRLALHSNILAVDPDLQNRGIGRLLKLEQRREALSRGITLMTWTFDPLQARNAYLNLNKLGAIARTYFQDIYGSASSSALHGELGTDRLLAEWWLDSPRVRNILEVGPLSGKVGEAGGLETLPPCILHGTENGGGIRGLTVLETDVSSPIVSLEIPVVLTELMVTDLDLARRWRLLSRELLPRYFAQGYQITRLVRVPSDGSGNAATFRTYYILEACENRSH